MALERIHLVERDYSGSVDLSTTEFGAMVIRAKKGKLIPTLNFSEKEILQNYGTPSSTYWGTFEAIEYCNPGNPLWVNRAIGTDYKYSGVDIKTSTITPFGTRTGRIPTSIDYTTIETDTTDTIATADGLTATYPLALTSTPITDGSMVFDLDGVAIAAFDAAGVISGTDATGSITYSTGVGTITFTGTVGTPADYTSTVDLAGTPVDTSVLPKQLAFNLTIDGVLYENVATTSNATYDNTDLVLTINTAVGSTVAAVDGVGGGVTITGLIGSSLYGNIIIEDPTDTVTYDSGVAELIDATFVEGASNQITEDTASTNPTGAVPSYGQVFTIDYIYTQNLSTSISHSFFYASPCEDDVDPIAIEVEWVQGSQYDLTLYRVDSVKGNIFVEGPTRYSLIEEVDESGRQLYVEQVFDETHPYLIPVINPSYVGTAMPVVANPVQFTGGTEGTVPTSGDYTTAWNEFQKVNKYRAKWLMDPYGTQYTALNNLVNNYHKFSHAIFPIPRGYNQSQMITYRQGLGLSTDRMSLSSNWAYITDPYNNNKVWTSAIGKIGSKYANHSVTYGGGKYAGIDENGQGGLMSTTLFAINKLDYDISEAQSILLEKAQVNHLMYDFNINGYVLMGISTLLPYKTDTSNIPTRVVYNFLKEKALGILREQIYAANDDLHQRDKKQKMELVTSALLAAGVVREIKVICDDTNNTDAVKATENFIMEIKVKATPYTKEVTLYIDRYGQTQEI